MDLSKEIETAKLLAVSLQSKIADVGKYRSDLDGRSATLDARENRLNDRAAILVSREKDVSHIESAEAVLAEALAESLRVKTREEAVVKGEDDIAKSSLDLKKSQEKLMRDQRDLAIHREQLTRDQTSFNKEKSAFEDQIKALKSLKV